jgi:hypothetical protein
MSFVTPTTGPKSQMGPPTSSSATTAVAAGGVGATKSSMSSASAAPSKIQLQIQAYSRALPELEKALQTANLLPKLNYQAKSFELTEEASHLSGQLGALTSAIAKEISDRLPSALKPDHLAEIRNVGSKLDRNNLEQLCLWVQVCCELIKKDVPASEVDDHLAELAKFLLQSPGLSNHARRLLITVDNYGTNLAVIRSIVAQQYQKLGAYPEALTLFKGIQSADLNKLPASHPARQIKFAALGSHLLHNPNVTVDDLLFCLERETCSDLDKNELANDLLTRILRFVAPQYDKAKRVLELYPTIKGPHAAVLKAEVENAPDGMSEAQIKQYKATCQIAESVDLMTKYKPEAGTIQQHLDEQFLLVTKSTSPADVSASLRRLDKKYGCTERFYALHYASIIGSLPENDQEKMVADLMFNKLATHESLRLLFFYMATPLTQTYVALVNSYIDNDDAEKAMEVLGFCSLSNQEKETIRFGWIANKLSEQGKHELAVAALKDEQSEKARNDFGSRIIPRLLVAQKTDLAGEALSYCTDKKPSIAELRGKVAALLPKKAVDAPPPTAAGASAPASSPPLSGFARGRAEVKRLWNSSFAFKLFSFLTAGLLPLFTLLINAIKKPGNK